MNGFKCFVVIKLAAIAELEASIVNKAIGEMK